jgi:transposase-like protein
MIDRAAFEALNVDFLDEAKCRAWLLKKLHPADPVCPGCARAIEDPTRLQRFWRGQRLNCEHCNKFYTALTDTIFSGSHLSFRQLFLLAALSGAGIKDPALAAAINITPESCRLWRKKFKSFPLLSG